MQTTIRGIPFRPIIGATGVEGYFREGYPHHKLMKRFIPGFDFTGMDHAAKTFTLSRNLGNMALKSDGTTPWKKFPDCVVVNFPAGAVLNAIGLSNFGQEFYLDEGIWQTWTKPFHLSFMSIAKTYAEKREEFRESIKLMKRHLPRFRTAIAYVTNYTCPNVGHKVDESMNGEIEQAMMEDMEAAKELDAAFIPKISVLFPAERAIRVSRHPRCDAICVSNTVPHGQLPDEIDWVGLFGKESPLKKYGGGGLSGKPITKIVQRWVDTYSKLSPTKPLCAGGGVMCAEDARVLLGYRCVQSVFIGSVAMVRPWRVKSIIRAAHQARK